MEFKKNSAKDLRSLDATKISETAKVLRKELVGMRMDVYNAGPQAKATARNMRKNLARLLTVAVEKAVVGIKAKVTAKTVAAKAKATPAKAKAAKSPKAAPAKASVPAKAKTEVKAKAKTEVKSKAKTK